MSVKISCHKLKGKYTRPITVETNDPSNPLITLNCNGEILESATVNPPQVNFGVISRTNPAATERKVTITPSSSPFNPKLKDTTIPAIEPQLVEVEPGKRWELVVKLTDPTAAPRVHGDIEVETGVPQAPVLKVPVFAMMSPRIVPDPRTVVVPKEHGADWKQVVHLAWDGPNPGHIVSASSDDPGVKVELQGKEGEAQDVVISLNEGFAPATRAYSVIVNTSDVEMPQISLPMRFLELTARPAVRSPTTRKPGAVDKASEKPKPAEAKPAKTTGGQAPP